MWVKILKSGLYMGIHGRSVTLKAGDIFNAEDSFPNRAFVDNGRFQALTPEQSLNLPSYDGRIRDVKNHVFFRSGSEPESPAPSKGSGDEGADTGDGEGQPNTGDVTLPIDTASKETAVAELEKLTGVGSTTASKMFDAGIKSLAGLVGLEVNGVIELADELSVSVERIHGWQSEAVELLK